MRGTDRDSVSHLVPKGHDLFHDTSEPNSSCYNGPIELTEFRRILGRIRILLHHVCVFFFVFCPKMIRGESQYREAVSDKVT